MNIGPDELKWLDGIVSPGVIKGQSIHHAVSQQREHLPVCERTIYRNFRTGNLFTARRGDLRRACRLKPRKDKRKKQKQDTCAPSFWPHSTTFFSLRGDRYQTNCGFVAFSSTNPQLGISVIRPGRPE